MTSPEGAILIDFFGKQLPFPAVMQKGGRSYVVQQLRFRDSVALNRSYLAAVFVYTDSFGSMTIDMKTPIDRMELLSQGQNGAFMLQAAFKGMIKTLHERVVKARRPMGLPKKVRQRRKQ